ncbi:helix-turn-helix transcriptional regulator [Rhodococcus baikonurensis]|uniref:Helix-turn-helix transcriptional regulator n=1 Tax=Rhodococcus baikonurensis TaxID=172041 RepID=A0ABV5XKN2_9NOCA
MTDSQSSGPMSRSLVRDVEQYLSTKQVSDRIGIPVSTLRYYRSKGIGPESHVQGRARVVYKLSKLQEWLTAQESNQVRGGVA